MHSSFASVSCLTHPILRQMYVWHTTVMHNFPEQNGRNMEFLYRRSFLNHLVSNPTDFVLSYLHFSQSFLWFQPLCPSQFRILYPGLIVPWSSCIKCCFLFRCICVYLLPTPYCWFLKNCIFKNSRFVLKCGVDMLIPVFVATGPLTSSQSESVLHNEVLFHIHLLL